MSKTSKTSLSVKGGSLPLSCRICLKNTSDESDQWLSLFEYYRDSCISQLICLIADVQYVDGDGYPAHICKDCLVDFETALNFKERCENSDCILRGFNNAPLINSKPIKTEERGFDQDINHVEDFVNYQDPINDEDAYVEDSVNYEDSIKNEVTDVKDSFDQEYLTTFGPPLRRPTNRRVYKGTGSEFEYTISNKGVSYAVTETNDEDTLEPSSKQLVGGLSWTGEVHCHDCGEMFRTKCKLRVHWKKVHLQESQTCQLCKRVFHSFFAFRKHIKLNETKPCLNTKFVFVEGVGKGRTYNCTKCTYSSKLIQSIRIHSRIHTGDKRYKCELCSKAFTQIASLHRHGESAHKQYRTEITCHYCGLFVQGGDKVYKHLNRHKSKKYQCDICKKFLKGKCNIINHLKRHSGVKPYKCEVCAALYATSSDLANHKRNSHQTRPPPKKSWYTCDLCGYRTQKNFILNKHTLKHSEKNHACGECGQFFDDLLKLEKHLEVHFGEKTYSCPLCDAKFYHRNGRCRHLKVKHNTLSAELKLPRRAFKRNQKKKRQ